MSTTRFRHALPIGLLILVSGTAAAAIEELANQASWEIPSESAVQARLLAWLNEQQATEDVRDRARKLWSAESTVAGSGDLLRRIAATVALQEPRAEKLIEACRVGATPAIAADARWLEEPSVVPLVKHNLQLLLARSLAQGRYFDEARDRIEDLRPRDVEDPASLLFYQAVVHHRLINRDRGLVAIDRLLERKQQIPRRYSVLAALMRKDLSQLKEGSLDDISRRMKDVERRLSLGRANQRVRDIEDEVIEMLDKLIKEEEQRQSQAAAAASNSIQSSNPAKDSVPMGGKGPGEVTKKDIGNTAGWGELPPKQREKAMQEIGREFPAHYREVIEEYFRELAKQQKK